jgi:hypothetical protein
MHLQRALLRPRSRLSNGVGRRSEGPQEPALTHAGPSAAVVAHEEVLVIDTYVAEPRGADKTFWLVGAALNGAMVLDTMSTFAVRRRCAGCVESTPYVGAFVNRGPLVTFTAGYAIDVGIMALAVKMKTSKKPQIQNIWWLLPVALTTGHLFAYRHSRGVAR